MSRNIFIKVISFFVIISLILNSVACTTTRPVANIETIQNDKKIEVHTKSSAIYRFDRWHLDDAGNIIGITAINQQKYSAHAVQADSIATVYTLDTRLTETVKVSIMVAGIATGIVLIWWMIRGFSHPLFPGVD